jgi:hypothetical protein
MRRLLVLLALLAAAPAAAQISFVATGALSSNGQPGLPSGWAQNDIFVVVGVSGPASLTGWTTAVNHSSIKVYWKRATSSESAPNFGSGHTMRMSAYRYALASGNPVEVVGAVAALEGYYSAEDITLPGVTTVTANAMLLAAVRVSGSYGTWLYGVQTNTAMTEAFADYGSSVPYALGLFHQTRASAGATGNAVTSGGADDEYEEATMAGVLLALTPGDPPPTDSRVIIIVN